MASGSWRIFAWSSEIVASPSPSTRFQSRRRIEA